MFYCSIATSFLSTNIHTIRKYCNKYSLKCLFLHEHISITVYLSAKKKYNLEIKVDTTDLDKMFWHRNKTVNCCI